MAPRLNNGSSTSASSSAIQLPWSSQASVSRSNAISPESMLPGMVSRLSMSLLSRLMREKRPPNAVAWACRAAASKPGMTISPLSLRRNPPSLRGIGAPVPVPIPRIAISIAASSWSAISAGSNFGMPSVINRICPLAAPAVCSNDRARSNASVGLEPGRGIMSGDSAVNRFSMVRRSSVSGATTWASPA